jgi:hypothetical protein
MLRKLNRYLARVSVFLITAALIAGMAGCDDYTPPSQNLEIQTWYDLDAVRNNLAGNHTLMNDLDSTTPGYEELASPWEPIGTRSVPFTGSFDGQDYEIRDMFITCPDERDVGLFGYVGEGGIIKDIGLVNATVTGGDYVGGMVGDNWGTVNNSYSTGSVTGHFGRVGGLVGSNRGTVSNSYSSSSVTDDVRVGGLVGANWDGTVINSYYNYDEVLINGENIITIGALFSEDFDEWLANDKFLDVNERLSQENGYYVVNNVTDFKELLVFGQNASLKFRLNNDLDLSTEPDFYIPYLAGEFDGNGHKISDLSLNFDLVSPLGLFGYLAPGGKVTQVGVENVNITGDSLVGSLVGWNRGNVSNSYSTGSVAGYHYYLGGLVGWNRGNVSNSYSTGSVTRAGYVSLYVGGLVGWNGGDISNSYSTGSVNGSTHVGGLVGRNEGGNVSNSFWDIQTSGQSTSAGGTGQNTTEMQYIATFSGAGWNITAVALNKTNPAYIWNIPTTPPDYPFLSWQPV